MLPQPELPQRSTTKRFASTTKSRSSLGFVFVAAALALGACAEHPTRSTDFEAGGPEQAVAASADEGAMLSMEIRQWLRDLRHQTRDYRDFDAAVAAGYGVALSPCVSSDAGGMGYHYGNVALIDPVIEALQPEVLLMEPRANGDLKFVGVEYLVPFGAWTDAQPPQLHGIEFEPNEEIEMWTLHVWTERRNPYGVFAPFNPKVSCQFATGLP